VRPHDVNLRLAPQCGEARAEDPPHVSEVLDLPEIPEAEKARNQVDLVRLLHAPAGYSGLVTPKPPLASIRHMARLR
jgi:hypothetical protein